MYIVDLVFIKYPRNIFNNHLSEFFLRIFRLRRYKVNDFREHLDNYVNTNFVKSLTLNLFFSSSFEIT